LWSISALLLSACASAPPPAAPPAPPAAPAPPKAAHICHPKASFVSFTSLGVPETEHAVDLASTEDHDYVLFSPARLLRLSRGAGQVKVEMVLGETGRQWKALALDPVDGSVWVATDEFTLVHISPSLRQTKVQLQRVAGTGGFVRLVVARDAIYAAPACAEDAVWRIDRAGKILSSAFPVVRDPGEPMPTSMECSYVRLDRDPEGRVVAWDSQARKLHRADDAGVWSEADGGVFAALPDSHVLKGVDLGTSNEQWYFNGAAGLFLWKGQPVFLGSPTIRNLGKGSDTILLVPRAGQAHDLIETCFGASVLRVASTPSRYAALIRSGIVLGDFATAPDLP
jgi:hypothetical protein